MQTLGLIIAFTLVTLAALVVVGIAAGIWFGIKSARPELLERGEATTSQAPAAGPPGS